MHRPLARIARPRSIPLHLLSPSYNHTSLSRSISTTPPQTPPPPSSPISTAPSSSSPSTPPPPSLPHLTPTSEIHLISTTSKTPTHRLALAIGHVRFSNPSPLRLIRSASLQKGDVLAVARIAGLQAVKKTGDIIPLAHPGLPIEGCVVRVEPVDGERAEGDSAGEEEVGAEDATRLTRRIGGYGGVRILVSVETTAKTGVEMEALAGVVGAALTVVDMCKGVDRGCVIEGVRVVGKKGGRSGGWGVWGEKGEEEGMVDKVDKEEQGEEKERAKGTKPIRWIRT